MFCCVMGGYSCRISCCRGTPAFPAGSRLGRGVLAGSCSVPAALPGHWSIVPLFCRGRLLPVRRFGRWGILPGGGLLRRGLLGGGLLGETELATGWRVGISRIRPGLAVRQRFVSAQRLAVPGPLLGLPFLRSGSSPGAGRAAAASGCVCGLWTVRHFLPIRC